MGVTALVSRRLAAWAARRPHVLLAAAAGATAERLAVEAEVARTGGVLAATPADADLLVVAGQPGPELAEAVERVWRQLPGPRARALVAQPAEAAPALRAALRALTGPAGAARDDGHSGGPAQDRGGGGHQGHGGMRTPGGLMMAERAEDRDGLTLDVLHVPLGPVLPDWPAGLVVDLTLQGDLVQSAVPRLLPPAAPVAEPYWTAGGGPDRPRRQAAAQLDSLGRLWAVAGWSSGAAAARRLRDDLLAGAPLAALHAPFRLLRRRARRSRALRWATDGLGVLTAEAARAAGVSGPAGRAAADGGDATARWLRWLDEIGRLLGGGTPPEGEGPRGRWVPGRPPSRALLDVAAPLMVGLDVAAARLVLASFDPDPDELAAAVPAGTPG